MLPNADRQRLPELLAQEWDVLIAGGGITGAGIALEAARRGLKCLLVEQRDFAWGTSSRSSKLVHGGLRYLKQGQFHLTHESVQERQKLLQQAAGLVQPQRFAFADYQGRAPGRWLFALGLAIYDAIAGQKDSAYYDATAFTQLAPHIASTGLKGGTCYTDAKTDDARLVLRVLQEARALGAQAFNYLRVDEVVREHGQACGARLHDACSGAAYTVRARVVVNATGAWAGRLPQNSAPRLRPLRGSHLVFPAWRLPVAQAVSLMHPRDGRPVFVFPWEGVTLAGTTDVDHRADLDLEAAITPDEVRYLMEMLNFQFPQLDLQAHDAVATYAGVRPVLDSGQADPSKEGRDHALWMDRGLLSVTGGKLTTFRVIAQDALRQIANILPAAGRRADARLFRTHAALPVTPALSPQQRERLQGRYGAAAAQLVGAAQPGELTVIPGTHTLWAELRWAARAEAVVRLEDLLLRRTRLGLQLRGGGVAELPAIRAICQPELGWSDAQWLQQQEAYLALWQRCYSVPAEL